MIQAGDKFAVRDLRQSVDEILDVWGDIKVLAGTPPLYVLVGDTMIDLMHTSPQMYAKYSIECYDDIKSSALSLDKQLRKKGFYTTQKFSYNYVTPGLTSEQIVKDAYCLEYFQRLVLASGVRRKHSQQIEQAIYDAFRVSYYYAQYIWACNPRVCEKIAQTLSCPGVENWSQIIGAILGAGFRFHPDDVYEFSINHINPDTTKQAYDARYAAQKKFKDDIMANYEIDTGCLVLSPESQKKLMQILTKKESPYLIQIVQRALGIKFR